MEFKICFRNSVCNNHNECVIDYNETLFDSIERSKLYILGFSSLTR